MGFQKTVLKQAIQIAGIFTVHYFEYARDFSFPGESHDFWELVYIDKGRADITADGIHHVLEQGDAYFHKPGEFHAVTSDHRVAPNIVVVSFECHSAGMSFFEGRRLRMGDSESRLLAEIIREAGQAFVPPLDDVHAKRLNRVAGDPPFGSEQLIKISLERMLIGLIRKGGKGTQERLPSEPLWSSDEKMVARVARFLTENTHRSLDFEQVCRTFGQSKTKLKVAFKAHTGMGVMQFFNREKIEEAKRMIREEPVNFTGIAEQLGYATVHYFSRHFKAHTGMSPTEYALSVKAKSE